jgi:hypothetical protein
VSRVIAARRSLSYKVKSSAEGLMGVQHIHLADSHNGDLKLPESDQSVPTTREALEELFQLLEEYAPTWYTEQHHDRAIAALLGRRVYAKVSRG